MAGRPSFALWAEAAQAIETLLTAIQHSLEDSPAESQRAASILTEGYLLAISSGLRCAARLAAACDREREVLAAFVLPGTASEAEQAETAAALRSLASELGETAVAEARRFRAEMQKLAVCLPDPGAPPEPTV